MQIPCCVLFASAILAAGCGSGPAATAPPFQPVADTRLLMEAIVDPHADVIWDSVGAEVTVDGTEEIQPATPEEWTAVRNSGLILAESGNLLMMMPRAVDDGDWMKAAQAMIDTGMLAVKAAEARNPDELFDAGGSIYAACTACHEKYWIDAPLRVQ